MCLSAVVSWHRDALFWLKVHLWCGIGLVGVLTAGHDLTRIYKLTMYRGFAAYTTYT